MPRQTLQRFGQMVVVVAVISVAGVAFFGTPSRPATIALASVAADNGNGNDNEDEYQTELEGTVLPVQCPGVRGSDPHVAAACINLPEGAFIPAINPGSNPPDMYVHNLDGAVRVVFRDPASLGQFREGDYVRIEGQRIHAYLFEAREATVEDDDDGDNDNDGDGGDNDNRGGGDNDNRGDGRDNDNRDGRDNGNDNG